MTRPKRDKGAVEHAPRERAIGFTYEMVRAERRVEGPKTQTRRVMALTEFGPSTTPGYVWHFRDKQKRWHDVSHARLLERCPYGAPGDLLYVRESYCVVDGVALYRADLTEEQLAEERAARRLVKGGMRWRSGRFMPRRYSRTLLRVTDLRVQRVQEISGEDARAEGVLYPVSTDDAQPGKCAPLFRIPDGWERAEQWGILGTPKGGPAKRKPTHDDLSRLAFSLLWDDINSKRGFGWDANPWCWCVSFERQGATT